MTFIIFGIPYDPHIRRVGGALQRSGVDVRVVPSIPPGGSAKLSWTLSNRDSSSRPRLGLARPDCEEVLPVEGRRALAWMRNKAQIDHVSTLNHQETVLCIKERSAWMKGWIQMTGARWINSLSEALEGEVKLSQLQRSIDLGMKIPRTIVTNCRQDVIEFMNRNSEYIIKPLATMIVPSHNPELEHFCMFTSDLTLEEVEDSSDEEWALAPAIIQEKIDKAYELRVIQVGDQARSVRIDPCEAGQTDFRRTSRANTYSFCETPSQLTEFGSNYLSAFGLDMGVFDFAVTAKGEYVFFECNPCGQWAWMEGVGEYGDHPISNFVAEQFQRLYVSLV